MTHSSYNLFGLGDEKHSASSNHVDGQTAKTKAVRIVPFQVSVLITSLPPQ